MGTGRMIIWMVIFSVCCFPCDQARAEARKMRIVYAAGYEPFSWSDKEGRAVGILVDLLDELLGRRLNMELSHEVFPWARAQKLVWRGDRDAFFTIPNKERAKYTDFSTLPIFTSRFVIYTGAGNPYLEEIGTIRGLDDLKRRTHLVNAHILGGGWHMTHLSGVKHLRIIPDSKKILELLKFNRIDVYIEQEALIDYQLMKLNLTGQIVGFSNVMDTTQWHLCVGKKSPFAEILPRLNSLMTAMEKDGTLDKVRKAVFAQYR